MRNVPKRGQVEVFEDSRQRYLTNIFSKQCEGAKFRLTNEHNAHGRVSKIPNGTFCCCGSRVVSQICLLLWILWITVRVLMLPLSVSLLLRKQDSVYSPFFLSFLSALFSLFSRSPSPCLCVSALNHRLSALLSTLPSFCLSRCNWQHLAPLFGLLV